MRDHARLMSPFNAPETPPAALLARARGEFAEMPGLRLTPAQAARLWGVEYPMACALLQTLADTRFLIRFGDGSYARPTA